MSFRDIPWGQFFIDTISVRNFTELVTGIEKRFLHSNPGGL